MGLILLLWGFTPIEAQNPILGLLLAITRLLVVNGKRGELEFGRVLAQQESGGAGSAEQVSRG
jgi:predicted GNAT family N-acyltransferase